MKDYTEAVKDFNRKIIDAMRVPSLMLIDDPIKAQSCDFKYGMTDQGDIVPLPSSLSIIWKFLSYPPESLSKDLYVVLKSAGGSEKK